MSNRRAVFLDRDGVLNRNVYYSDSGEWEAPRKSADLELLPGVPQALIRLRAAGYALFLVSNQPSFAKGKTGLTELHAVHDRLCELVGRTIFDSVYYCFHHPEGVVPEFSGPCRCRKPSPYFLELAAKDHGIDLSGSWMIGDRHSDVLCGRAAGARTIQVDFGHPSQTPAQASPDHRAADLPAAVELILRS